MGNNLKSLREAHGLTLDEAALRMGLSRGGYIKLERGERRLTSEYIARAASVYRVPQVDVIGGDEPDTVPLVGYVGAGAEAHFYATGQGPFELVPAPEGSNEKTVAVEIRGTSLGALFDQWLVFYDEIRTPVTPDLIGKLCVVGLPDERVLIKQIKPSRERGLYHLLSNTEPPILDAQVDWAARVRNLVPR